MNIVNLVPHPIKLVDETTGKFVIIRQSRHYKPIRIVQPVSTHSCVPVRDIHIPIKTIQTGEACADCELPPQIPGTIYVVSRVVAETYRDTRPDFVFPYDFQRGHTGSIMGCYSLARFDPT